MCFQIKEFVFSRERTEAHTLPRRQKTLLFSRYRSGSGKRETSGSTRMAQVLRGPAGALGKGQGGEAAASRAPAERTDLDARAETGPFRPVDSAPQSGLYVAGGKLSSFPKYVSLPSRRSVDLGAELSFSLTVPQALSKKRRISLKPAFNDGTDL